MDHRQRSTEKYEILRKRWLSQWDIVIGSITTGNIILWVGCDMGSTFYQKRYQICHGHLDRFWHSDDIWKQYFKRKIFGSVQRFFPFPRLFLTQKEIKITYYLDFIAYFFCHFSIITFSSAWVLLFLPLSFGEYIFHQKYCTLQVYVQIE